MVTAFRLVPPACDSISNRKATYRHRRSSITRSVSPSRRGITHRGIACPAPGSWPCKPACTATPSARCTANWKPTAWWRPWPVRAYTFATSKNPVKSRHPAHPQPGRHRPRPRSTQMRQWPAECRMHLATDQGTADPKSTGACAAVPAYWSAPRRRRSLDADRRGTGTPPGRAGGSGATRRAKECSGELQQRHGGHKPLFPPARRGSGQEAQRSCRGR